MGGWFISEIKQYILHFLQPLMFKCLHLKKMVVKLVTLLIDAQATLSCSREVFAECKLVRGNQNVGNPKYMVPPAVGIDTLAHPYWWKKGKTFRVPDSRGSP